MKRELKLYCFSPPVMIATFTIELVLLAYTLVKYRLTPITRLVSAMLLMLAIFQIAEFNVCGDSSAISAWSRVGFIAITMLPALGLHLITKLAGRRWNWLVLASYVSGIGLALVFGLSKASFNSHICSGNYVIFQLAPTVGGIYFAYYYFWLCLGILISLGLSIKASVKVREALILQAVGYLIFLLPTAVVNTLNPKTISGIPSIMCGFAVLYAIILAFGIVPLTVKRRGKP